jgi:hypothetical protein
MVAQRSIESDDCNSYSDDDCESEDDDDFEFDEKLMKNVSVGVSSSSSGSSYAKIAAEISQVAIGQTTTTTTTTTTTQTCALFNKDSCPRRFSDCSSDSFIAQPNLSTQPSISALSSTSSADLQSSSVVVVEKSVVVAVGGGESKRGGSLDSGMQGMRFSGGAMRKRPEEEEEEEEQEEKQQQHKLHQLLHPQGIIGGRGICGDRWNLIPVKSEPLPKPNKKCTIYCLDADMIECDAVADDCAVAAAERRQ